MWVSVCGINQNNQMKSATKTDWPFYLLTSPSEAARIALKGFKFPAWASNATAAVNVVMVQYWFLSDGNHADILGDSLDGLLISKRAYELLCRVTQTVSGVTARIEHPAGDHPPVLAYRLLRTSYALSFAELDLFVQDDTIPIVAALAEHPGKIIVSKNVRDILTREGIDPRCFDGINPELPVRLAQVL
jgi:hypothetical protein